MAYKLTDTQRMPDGIQHSTRTIQSYTINLTDAQVDPHDTVEVILATPDGRWHRVRVNESWFIPADTL